VPSWTDVYAHSEHLMPRIELRKAEHYGAKYIHYISTYILCTNHVRARVRARLLQPASRRWAEGTSQTSQFELAPQHRGKVHGCTYGCTDATTTSGRRPGPRYLARRDTTDDQQQSSSRNRSGSDGIGVGKTFPLSVSSVPMRAALHAFTMGFPADISTQYARPWGPHLGLVGFGGSGVLFCPSVPPPSPRPSPATDV